MRLQLLKNMLFFLAICTFFIDCKGPKGANCKSDKDCGNINGASGVCVLGQCQECRDDSNCSDQKKCVDNRCEKICDTDSDCDKGYYCLNGICKLECSETHPCPEGEVCRNGKCINVSAMTQCSKSSDCEPGFICENGICTSSQMSSLNTETCSGQTMVNFDFDKYELRSQDMQILAQTAKCLKDHPNANVRIEGHTDNVGTAEYNLSLGLKRANSVKKYLKKVTSIDAKTTSYGKERLLNPESSSEAHQQNRRAEIILESEQG